MAIAKKAVNSIARDKIVLDGGIEEGVDIEVDIVDKVLLDVVQLDRELEEVDAGTAVAERRMVVDMALAFGIDPVQRLGRFEEGMLLVVHDNCIHLKNGWSQLDANETDFGCHFALKQ